MTLDDVVLSVRPLSIVAEGDEFLVGDPTRAEYVLLPKIGVVVIRLLEAGRTVRQASAAVGPGVDVPDFVETLLELDFVSRAPRRVAASRTRRIRSGMVQPLFGHVAWGVYLACALLGAAILVTRPDLRPRSDDLFLSPSPLVSIACFTLLMYVLALVHEACHWAAARAEGLDASLRISRRLYFLAFETDLSGLWSLPRRRRYGALLAGMAFDATLLCAVVVARLGDVSAWWHLGQPVAAALAAVAFAQLAALAAQCFVFMRTDLYAVLITVTGCVNLWRVNQLCLLGRVRRLSPEQQRELGDAHPRDLEVARWYAWVYVGGLIFAAAFLGWYFLPATVRLAGWLLVTIAAADLKSWEFWSAVGFAAIVLSPQGLTAGVLVRDFFAHLVQARGVDYRPR